MAAPYPWSVHPDDFLDGDYDTAVSERREHPDGPCEDRLPDEGITDRDQVE